MKTVLEWKRCADEQPQKSGDYFTFMRTPGGGVYFTTLHFCADEGAGWNCHDARYTEENLNNCVYMWAEQPDRYDFYEESEEKKNG